MTRFNLEEDFSSEQPAHQPPRGSGSLEDPFRPNAMEDEIVKVAEHARKTGQPAYCNFEGSNFRINPDGTYERSHRMPPLREGIEEIITEVLQSVQEAWCASEQ